MSAQRHGPAEKRIAVVGCGGWGTALAHLCADSGLEPVLWGRNSDQLEEIARTHRNTKYLQDLPLAEGIRVEADLARAIESAATVLLCVPTQQIRSVLKPVAGLLADRLVVNTAKGIEQGSHLRVSQVVSEVVGPCRYAVLSGPSFAHEVVRRLPTAVTVASESRESAVWLQRSISTKYFRSYVASDVIGVEIAGALKNVVAIASGIVSGLALGYNAQAALTNRGLAEIARVGRALGADPLTFLGLSGMGDLVLTCTGPLSRNRKLGELLGQGRKRAEAERELGGVAEGAYTVLAALELAGKLGVSIPILEQVHAIVHEGASPAMAVEALMSRELTEERE